MGVRTGGLGVVFQKKEFSTLAILSRGAKQGDMNSTATPSVSPRRNARPKDSACSASPSGRESRVYLKKSNPYEAAARSRKVYATRPMHPMARHAALLMAAEVQS